MWQKLANFVAEKSIKVKRVGSAGIYDTTPYFQLKVMCLNHGMAN